MNKRTHKNAIDSVNKNMFNVSIAIEISDSDARRIFDHTLHNIQDSCMGRYSRKAYITVKQYKYVKIANHFGISTEAVSKWFRLTRIPNNQKKELQSLLNLDNDDLISRYRGENE